MSVSVRQVCLAEMKDHRGTIKQRRVSNKGEIGPLGLVVERPPSDREVVGSNPGRVKPKTLKLVLW